MTFFSFFNDQILKMNWLKDGVHFFLEQVLPLDPQSKVTGSLHFFIYDSLKIFLLLSFLIFFISYIQSFFPPERSRKILGGFHGIGANILGALLGTMTPFCSCSSIPIFIGFTGAGLPLGVTFSFLISSPLVDLASILLLASIFNVKVAVAYVLTGLLLAVVGGSLIEALKLEKYVASFVFETSLQTVEETRLGIKERLSFALGQVQDIVKRVWLYVLLGVAIGAFIHNWIPQEILSLLLGSDKWYSVILATLAGIPMYADIFGTLPIAEALVSKGVGIGTVLSFMMAVTALSLPSLILLKKVVQTKLLLIFVGIVTVGILIIGYVFNQFSYLLL